MAEAAVEAAKDVAALSPAAASGGQAARDTHGLTLPLAKVKRIMRDHADVKTISSDSHFVLARATELFLGEIAVRAHAVMQEDQQRKGNIMDYKDVAAVVHSWDALDFLHDMVPKKEPVAEVLAQLKKQQEQQQQQELQQHCAYHEEQQEDEEQQKQKDANDKDEQ